MKIAILVLFTVVVLATASANECTTGAVKQVECNSCRCLNGVWACTKMGCLTKRAAECSTGETKRDDCNSCFCSNGQWACTLKACLRKRAIPARFEEVSRNKRAMHVAEDLKDTPCAPNDYFQVDCNVCYCNLEHSGYLCTTNFCYNNDEFTTVQIPLENDTMLILSRDGAKLIENASSMNNSKDDLGYKRLGESINIGKDFAWYNETEPPFNFTNHSISSE